MMETKLQQIREHHAAFRKHIEETGNSLRYKELPVLTEEMFLLFLVYWYIGINDQKILKN